MKWTFLLLFGLPFCLIYGKVHYSNVLYEEAVAHIVEIDPRIHAIELVNAKNSLLGVETVTEMAEKQGAEVAINAGFFYSDPRMGAPAGILKIGGVLVSSTDRTRGAIGWSGGGKKVLLDRLDMNIFLTFDGGFFPIDGINLRPRENSAIFYTSDYALNSSMRGEGEEVFVNCENFPGSVLSFFSRPPLHLPENHLVSLTFSYLPVFHPHRATDWQQSENILGGTPLLILDGKKLEDFLSEKTLLDFLLLKKPRTAVGILPNGNWLFIFVEGPLNPSSQGMTISQLAKFLQTLGVRHALNLDGGRSSTLYYPGKTIGSFPEPFFGKPSERAVGNALIAKPREKER